MNAEHRNPAHDRSGRRCRFVELPTVKYRQVWDLQQQLVAARREKAIDTDIILMLEHFPVFTLGRRGGLDNLRISKDFIESRGIEIIHVERGGDITYHGPGQVVMYPIIDLRSARLRVVDYVTALEEVMIQTALEWGIEAGRNPANRGVWVGNNKLGSVGIAVRRGVSYHGLALNVNTSLEPFTWVNPCGLQGVKVTSMKAVKGVEINMDDVRGSLLSSVQDVFGVELERCRLKDIHCLTGTRARPGSGEAM